MGRLETPRQQIGWGLFCLAVAGTVLGIKLVRQASWDLDALEVVLVLLPVGAHLVLKGWLGIDLVALARGKRGGADEGDPG